jgi:hypothetical protein
VQIFSIVSLQLIMKINKLFPFLLAIFCTQICLAQPKKMGYVSIKGTVFDISAKQPIESVLVASTSGSKTITDSLGHYTIIVKNTDSIWFSMLGKPTVKFPVDTIANPDDFVIMIHLKVQDLPTVVVRTKNYRLDSLQNRIDYAKYFNYQKPSLGIVSNNNYLPGSIGSGFDLDEIINIFRTKRNRSLAALQKRLVLQEQEKYVDYRFNKNFVRKLTKLSPAELDSFMLKYKPDFEFVKMVNDLELGYSIQRSFLEYKFIRQQRNFKLRKKDN